MLARMAGTLVRARCPNPRRGAGRPPGEGARGRSTSETSRTSHTSAADRPNPSPFPRAVTRLATLPRTSRDTSRHRPGVRARVLPVPTNRPATPPTAGRRRTRRGGRSWTTTASGRSSTRSRRRPTRERATPPSPPARCRTRASRSREQTTRGAGRRSPGGALRAPAPAPEPARGASAPPRLGGTVRRADPRARRAGRGCRYRRGSA